MNLRRDAGDRAEMPGAADRGAAEPEIALPARVVLMVMYHFPPIGGVSMARNVANVRYLPRHGWKPVVLTARTAGELVDAGAASLVPPGVRVIRAWCPEPAILGPAVGALRGIAARRQAPDSGPAQVGGDLTTADGSSPATTPSIFNRMRRLAFFPDNQVAWLPFAVVGGVRAARSARVDAVYSTSSPVTAHLVAGLVSRLVGIAWVAEFRDPWVGNPVAEALPWFHRRLRARLERWVVRSADRLVFLSPSTARTYRRRYPLEGITTVITNGHDRLEVVPQGEERRAGPYRIVWAGSLYRPTELAAFLEALANLAERRPSLANELDVAFYGEVEATCRATADAWLRRPAVASIVRFPGFVSRQVALHAIADADAALVMLGDGPGMGQFVPGKLFDYLGQNKQILAVLPPGDARDILSELDWGVVADPDPESVASTIERLLAMPAPTRLADPDGRYERAGLARCLADVLSEAYDARRTARIARHQRPRDLT